MTSNISFEVWMVSLRTDLTTWQLLDLIDPKVPRPAGLSEAHIDLSRNAAKDIIISHVYEDNLKKILGMTEPMQILAKLQESRQGEISATLTSVRTRLYNVRMAKGERVHKFLE